MEKAKKLVVVPGNGWPKDSDTGCSAISEQLLDHVLETIEGDEDRESILVLLGGVGAGKDNHALTESQRMRRYVENKQATEREVATFSTREKISQLLGIHTDCDEDFEGKPSRDTRENAQALDLIIQNLREQGVEIEGVHVVSMIDHAQRIREIFGEILAEGSSANLPLHVQGVRVNYDPNNAQWHLRGKANRVIWEGISKGYRLATKVIGEERIGEVKNAVKAKLGLIK